MVMTRLLALLAAEAAAEPCCQACEEPLVKYFSVDVPHGFCGEACMDPKKFSVYKIFEKNLTLADSPNPCSEQFTPTGTHYTEYSETVTHGVPGLLSVTLDLYGPDAELEESVAENETIQVYHLFEREYTGLANKDAGDFDGELNFIFLTFQPMEKTNPEAAIGDNVFEMSTVSVTGWGQYQPCNAPGCTGAFTCPADNGDYCCTNGHSNTESTLPGRKSSGGGSRRRKTDDGATGYWYSFPRESEGVTWTELSVDRRINSSCLAQAWRDEAGGCSSCTELASQCTGNCIKQALTRDQLKATWDLVFSNSTMCPDVPYVPPAPTPPTPPTPTPVPSPTPPSGDCTSARDEKSCADGGCSWCTFGTSSFGLCRESCGHTMVV